MKNYGSNGKQQAAVSKKASEYAHAAFAKADVPSSVKGASTATKYKHRQ